jgi:predicted HicB family RNase H-like nuclease
VSRQGIDYRWEMLVAMKRLTIRLNPDLLKITKEKAAAEDRTLDSLVEEALRLVLSDSQSPRQ